MTLVNCLYSSSVVRASAKIMSRAGLSVLCRTIERGLLALDRMRIRTSHHDEVAVSARIDGRLDAIDHLLRRHELFAGSMPTALGRDLIFEMHRRCASLAELHARPRDVERPAPTRIGVDEQRQMGRGSDSPYVFAHVVERRDAEIRQSVRSVGDTRA